MKLSILLEDTPKEILSKLYEVQTKLIEEFDCNVYFKKNIKAYDNNYQYYYEFTLSNFSYAPQLRLTYDYDIQTSEFSINQNLTKDEEDYIDFCQPFEKMISFVWRRIFYNLYGIDNTDNVKLNSTLLDEPSILKMKELEFKLQKLSKNFFLEKSFSTKLYFTWHGRFQDKNLYSISVS